MEASRLLFYTKHFICAVGSRALSLREGRVRLRVNKCGGQREPGAFGEHFACKSPSFLHFCY